MDATLAAQAPQTLIPEPRTLSEKLATLPLKPMISLLVGGMVLAAVAVAFILRGGADDYRVLYSGLTDKDGGAVIAQLSQMNVPYKFSEGGGAILIPGDRVADTRMKLSNLGLPKSSVVGYELLDAQKFGQTQAGEDMSMKRATEGELMRTIGSLSAVEQVRVHLALPTQNGFFREQQKPSASVMLTLHPGRSLDRAQLAGIVHLVSSSVPDLSPKSVSVVDGSGALLTESADGGERNGLDATQLDYVRNLESRLQKRVVELLEPVVGRENLRSTITAEVDFSETMAVTEAYKPNQGPEATAAVRSLQTMETNQAGSTTPTGVPGAQSNQPPVPATAPINGTAQPLQAAQAGASGGNGRRESTTAFELDKTQRTTRSATGTIQRVSAAVVVNHRSTTDNKGRTTTTPLTPEEIANLTALVEQGVGFNAQRGDTVKVINAPFRTEPAPKTQDVPLWKQPWVIDLAKSAAMPVALAIVAGLIVMTMIRPAMKTLMAPPPAPEPGSTLSEVVGDDPALLADESQTSTETRLALGQPEPPKNLEDARQLARQNPAAVANIVRNMMNGEQAAS